MSIVNRLINNPDSYSLEMLQRGVQDGVIPPYIGIPLIQQKMQEKQKSQAAQKGQINNMPSVAEQVMSQASQSQGIDNLPSNLPAQYADGGIVAFAGGGSSSLAKMLLEDEDDDDYLSAVQSAMDQIEAMRGRAMGSAPVSYESVAPGVMSKESKEGVSVKVGNEPAKTIEHQTKEVSKPAGLEDLLALVQQKESGGQRFNRSGEVLTSPKGAMGEMQVMPGTARDPGFGIRPAKAGDLDDLARVGREYYTRMLDKYGDPKIAAVAYNWGPGNTDKWLSAGADPNMLPAETRKYIKGFAEGGITSIKRFDVGGLTASQMMNLSLEDLSRMVRMSEPGAAEELARRQANYLAGRGSEIGPARMAGSPPVEVRSPAMAGKAPSSPATAARSGFGFFGRLLGPLGIGLTGYETGQEVMNRLQAQEQETYGKAAPIAPELTPEEIERASKPAFYPSTSRKKQESQGIKPLAPLWYTPAGVASLEDAATREEREQKINMLKMQAAAAKKPTPPVAAPPAATDVPPAAKPAAASEVTPNIAAAPEAAAKPATPAESEGMSALRKYIQEGMAEAKSQKEIDKYMALLQAGFGMLGGKSGYAAENIARGALLGAQAYQEAAKTRAADQKSLLAAQLGLERSEQLGKLREAQLEAGALGKEERNRLQAAQIASRMESDWMNRAEQAVKAQISKNPLISMDETKSNALIQEARATARNKLNMHEPYRRLLMKAYEGYDPGKVDVGPEIDSLIGKYLQPKK